MRTLACGVLIGALGLVAGCSSMSEPSFATRNAEANLDLDLQSLVRAQSNDLLSLTQDLESYGKRGFTSAKRLTRDLEKTVIHMDQLHMNLPALLAAQDVELAELRDGVSNGIAQKSTLKARGQEIQTYRKALLGSLNASAVRANSTAQQLTATLDGGRTDLQPQAQAAHSLARDLDSARSMIEMQL